MFHANEHFAFVAGWKAWFGGILLSDNPYPRGSVDWFAWHDGWFDAE